MSTLATVLPIALPADLSIRPHDRRALKGHGHSESHNRGMWIGRPRERTQSAANVTISSWERLVPDDRTARRHVHRRPDLSGSSENRKEDRAANRLENPQGFVPCYSSSTQPTPTTHGRARQLRASLTSKVAVPHGLERIARAR